MGGREVQGKRPGGRKEELNPEGKDHPAYGPFSTKSAP